MFDLVPRRTGDETMWFSLRGVQMMKKDIGAESPVKVLQDLHVGVKRHVDAQCVTLERSVNSTYSLLAMLCKGSILA